MLAGLNELDELESGQLGFQLMHLQPTIPRFFFLIELKQGVRIQGMGMATQLGHVQHLCLPRPLARISCSLKAMQTSCTKTGRFKILDLGGDGENPRFAHSPKVIKIYINDLSIMTLIALIQRNNVYGRKKVGSGSRLFYDFYSELDQRHPDLQPYVKNYFIAGALYKVYATLNYIWASLCMLRLSILEDRNPHNSQGNGFS